MGRRSNQTSCIRMPKPYPDKRGLAMGSSVAKLIDVERTSWSKPHNLETNETYAGQQREIIDNFFKVGDNMQLCLKLYPMEYPGAANDKYEHWFITNGDGSWVLE